jgi:opacity protein-like surface antigen
MIRSIVAASACGLALLAMAAVAPAASPIKGAKYKGSVEGGQAKVILRVSDTGKRLKFVLRCYGTTAVKKSRVPIDDDGKFEFNKPYFTATGKFVKRKKAKGSISGNACLLPSTANWTATKT